MRLLTHNMKYFLKIQVQITSTENSALEQVNGAVQASIASTEDNAEMTDKENKESAADEEEADNDEIDSRHIPCDGMQFKTDDEAYTFFNFYAYLIGFSIVIAHSLKTSDKKRNNEVIKYTYKCNRHGKNQDNATNQVQKKKGTRNTNVLVRTDCKCVMVVRENNGIWSVIRLDLSHNHNLCPPEERKFLYSHKDMTQEEKSLILTLKECNIPTRSMVVILASLRGGLSSLPYTKKDISNVASSSNSETKNKDMSQILRYLRKKEAEDPGFYFKLKLDENNKVTNMFWTDGRCRDLYEQFGDFVSFDTTYKTNRYDLPFAPFVGMTGHANTCIFGCAFLGDETIETFKWVFETFLTAMGGKEPRSIITDQDNAMRSAIAQVIKSTKHRNCLFHIMKNCREKTSTTFTITSKTDETKKQLYKDFDDIVHNCLTEQEFETLWPQMIEKYNLQNVKYLQLMFKARATYIPVYFKNDWFPFIHSTTLSEGTNARYKKEVGPRHSVTSFLKEHDRINDRIFETKHSNDHKSNTKRPKEFWSDYCIEEQACELYNSSIFERFQLELEKTLMLQTSIIEEGKTYLVFAATNQTRQELRPRKYVVMTDLTNEDFSCICAKFSKDGILCCHVLKIMLQLNVQKIPDKYIIDRWRKREKKIATNVERFTYNGDNLALRYNILSKKGALISSKACKKVETYNYLLEEMDRLDKHIDSMLAQEEQITTLVDIAEDSMIAEDETITEPNEEEQLQEKETNEEEEIQDPDQANTKGRKSIRRKRIVEQMIDNNNKKKKRSKGDPKKIMEKTFLKISLLFIYFLNAKIVQKTNLWL